MFNEIYVDISITLILNGIDIALILNVYILRIRDKVYVWLRLGLWTPKTGFITYYLYDLGQRT